MDLKDESDLYRWASLRVLVGLWIWENVLKQERLYINWKFAANWKVLKEATKR